MLYETLESTKEIKVGAVNEWNKSKPANGSGLFALTL